jgi:hypothetical protein
MSKNDEKFKKLLDDFELIQEESKDLDFDIRNHVATTDHLPDLGRIDLYDYESDLVASTEKSMDVLESLVELYLSEFPDLRKHKYIKTKMREDALIYAETLFLQKMTRKNLLSILRNIDNGENSSRMYEVANQTIKEIRENSKFGSSIRTDLEKYYKEFRDDIIEVTKKQEEKSEVKIDKTDDNSDNGIIDPMKLNDMINDVLSKKSKDGGKKK